MSASVNVFSWQSNLKGDSQSWLLENGDAGIRFLAMRDLLDTVESDPELREVRKAAHQKGPIAAILAQMNPVGYWMQPGPGYLPKYRSTVWAIILLAQLGAAVQEDERIARACRYVLDHALNPGGQFSTSGPPSGTIDCLQGNLCWALLELGFVDARLETAFEWMARTVTGEGIAPLGEKNAPVRYYAGKCGPRFACGANNNLPCAWGAVKVLLALAKWSKENRTPLMQRAIDQGVEFLFSVDPVTAAYATGYTDKPSGNWWKFGFPVFYVTDLLQLAEAVTALGYGNDPRLARTLELIWQKQDKNGRWALEYDYAGKTWVEFGEKKQPNPWVTLRALKVLKQAG